MKRLCLALVLLAGVVSAEARYRGFNLLEMFHIKKSEGRFREDDFRMMKEWGFNFVRLPLDYRFWIKDGKWDAIDESKLVPIDEAIALGQKYGIHVQICFHRIPGYTVARPYEERYLFTDDEALRVSCLHWEVFAKRYKHISNKDVSFNLFNEPEARVTEAQYEHVASALVKAIRAVSPGRTIVADGLSWGKVPCAALYPLGVEQATRGYNPMSVSHYRAEWVGTPTNMPSWPPSADPQSGVELLRKENIEPWLAAEKAGVPVMVGEFGAYSKTPHGLTLAWMEDNLKLWKEHNWGWALWNLRGEFGILDSQREDVVYEDYQGHKLDRKMLDLILRY